MKNKPRKRLTFKEKKKLVDNFWAIRKRKKKKSKTKQLKRLTESTKALQKSMLEIQVRQLAEQCRKEIFNQGWNSCLTKMGMLFNEHLDYMCEMCLKKEHHLCLARNNGIVIGKMFCSVDYSRKKLKKELARLKKK